MDLHVGHVIHLKEILVPKSIALIPVMKCLTFATVAMSAQKLKEQNGRVKIISPEKITGQFIHSDKAKNAVDIME